jgi:hypothetical protein
VHTNDMLTGRCLCVCVELETHFTNLNPDQMARQGQAPRPKSICASERVAFGMCVRVLCCSFFIWLWSWRRQRRFFGPFFELTIGLFALSRRPHTSPGHSLHILTIFTKLYRLIYAIPSHHYLSPTWTKNVKIEISLQ